MTWIKNEHGASIRVCDECKQPVAGKRHGWVVCGEYACNAEVCTTCRTRHKNKHAREHREAKLAILDETP